MSKRFTPKDYEIICGVYSITNKLNNKKYIGKSDNIYVRWDEHRKDLNKCVHHNKHLQRAWNKYGEENFIFEIVEKCKNDDIAYQRERYWVRYYDSFKNGYNMNEGGTGGLGYTHTEENIEKMSKLQKERMKNPKAREKLSQAHNALKRPLIQINLLDNSIVNWDSKNKAGKTLNLSIAGIYTALNSESHFAYDSLWFYEEDYKNLETSSYSLNSDVYHKYTKYHQYNFKGDLLKIWTFDELNASNYRNNAIFKCCDFQKDYYENSIWLYDKDVDKLNKILLKYKSKANIYCELVDVFDSSGNYIRSSKSIYDESLISNLRTYDIYLCCIGERRSIHNFIFKYKNKAYLYENGEKEGLLKREKQMSHIKKKIIQYDLDMNVIKIWNSITDIHNELGYDRGTIINNCKGRTTTSHNFIWKYYEEESVA